MNNGSDAEDKHYERLEDTFNEPYPNEAILRQKYIDALVKMEMEYDYPDDLKDGRVGNTIEEVRKYFEDCDYAELKTCWLDTFGK